MLKNICEITCIFKQSNKTKLIFATRPKPLQLNLDTRIQHPIFQKDGTYKINLERYPLNVTPIKPEREKRSKSAQLIKFFLAFLI